MDKPTFPKRRDMWPLYLPEDIYAVLSCLKTGEPVPPTVFISDYKDGSIPPWTVVEIDRHGSALVLTIIDPTAPIRETLFTPSLTVGCDIFTLPTKTLAGPLYGYHPGCVHARNPLADIRQHARQFVDRARKAERGAA